MDYNGLDTILETLEGISALAFKVPVKVPRARDDLSPMCNCPCRGAFICAIIIYRTQESSFLRRYPRHKRGNGSESKMHSEGL